MLIWIADLGLFAFLRYSECLEHGWHMEDTPLIFVEWKNLGIVTIKWVTDWIIWSAFLFCFVISFFSFRIGADNECWYFLLLSILLCKLLFSTLLFFSGLLHLGVWNNPGSKGTINSSCFVFSALTILDPEMLICKANLIRIFHLNYLYRHLNRTSLLFMMQVISAIFQALMELSILVH